MWSVAVAITESPVAGEYGHDDRRYFTELHHGKHLDACLAAEESLTTWSWVGTSFVWQADRAVDKREVRDGGVLFGSWRKQARRGQPRCLPASRCATRFPRRQRGARPGQSVVKRRHCCW